MTDRLGRELDALFGDGPPVMAHIGAGKIRAIAATSQRRSEIFPDVPTFVEQGFADTVADQWAGVLAPARTPAAVVAKLNAAIVAVMRDSEVRAKLAQNGVVPAAGAPGEVGKHVRDEYPALGRLMPRKGS